MIIKDKRKSKNKHNIIEEILIINYLILIFILYIFLYNNIFLNHKSIKK